MLNDVETVKRVILKVLQSQIPEALPEYEELPKSDGGSELVLVLHLEQLAVTTSLKRSSKVRFSINCGKRFNISETWLLRKR